MASGAKVLTSSLLLVSVKAIQRSLGLVSTLILARLLLPEDFGIVAIAAITLQLATILSNTGIQQYIPQKDSVDDTDVNTAWSIDVLMKFGLWLVMLLAAPFIGAFYDNEPVVGAIQVVSIVILLRALQNPGLHLLRRELSYKTIFWLLSTQKIISFIFVVTIAVYTGSFWAIIVGDIVSAIVGIVGSYVMHPYRPRFTLKRRLEQWSFTKWMFARGIMGFFRAQLDNLMVSKMFTIGELGIYNVIRGISVLPATDIIAPASEPLLSSFSRVKHDLVSLDRQFRTALLLGFLLILPICALLAAFSDQLVLVLLGENWRDKGPLLANLTVLLFSFALGSMLGNLYIAIGKIRLIFVYNVISLLFIFSFLLLFFKQDLAHFALTRGALGLVSTLAWMFLALYFTGTRMVSFILTIMLPPVLISVSAVLLTMHLTPQPESIVLSLVINLTCFGLAYFLLVGLAYYGGLSQVGEWNQLRRFFVDYLRRRAGS